MVHPVQELDLDLLGAAMAQQRRAGCRSVGGEVHLREE